MLFVLHPDFQLYFIEKNIKLIFNSSSLQCLIKIKSQKKSHNFHKKYS